MKDTPRPVDHFRFSDLQYLNEDQVRMIDHALGEVGDFGEVRLVVSKRRFRFLILQKSFDAINSTPEALIKEFRNQTN